MLEASIFIIVSSAFMIINRGYLKYRTVSVHPANPSCGWLMYGRRGYAAALSKNSCAGFKGLFRYFL